MGDKLDVSAIRDEGSFMIVGDPVEKVGGDYRFEGHIVARFRKRSGELRYVVEDERGILMIYSARNLRPRVARAEQQQEGGR